MKKIFVLLVFSISFLFAGLNFQTASKEDLMKINGIGMKKANAIIEYRKKHKIKTVDDLIKIKGFGKKLVSKIKKSKVLSK